MREIKFRAWLKENHSGNEQMFYQNNQYLQSFLRRCSQFSNTNGREHEKYGNYELMQFTGLKDKNGKEVFESDIVMNKYGHKYVIVWFDLHVGWGIDNGSSISNLFMDDDIKNLTVIGNIHENPDLLK